jgi:histidinol dehydrogenase
VSAPFPIARVDSRAGRRILERLARRGAAVLDRRTLRQAAAVVERVRRGGDRALLDAVRELDGLAAESVADLALASAPGDVDLRGLPAGFADAFERALAAVERFHLPQRRNGYRVAEEGVEIEEVVTPLRRVGIYIPGGRASYPSTVLMTAVPARIAGVAEIAIATPPAGYRASAPLRYALARLGIHEVWGMGGAQAIAAFAYGTETIRRVDKIVGPGNAWVTAAKRLVAGEVGIDGLAGPSEVVVVADAGDADVDPEAVAADLLAQAEHDPRAAAVLVTNGVDFARQVAAAVERQLAGLATAATARAALSGFGAALLVADWEEALAVVERLAPEHLQLVGTAAEALAPRVRSAGAVFLGAATPEVFGDYLAGPSHVLPTCGSARFASGLGVADFLRRGHRVRFTPAAAAERATAAAILADAEGLPAHAAAARRRLR